MFMFPNKYLITIKYTFITLRKLKLIYYFTFSRFDRNEPGKVFAQVKLADEEKESCTSKGCSSDFSSRPPILQAAGVKYQYTLLFPHTDNTQVMVSAVHGNSTINVHLQQRRYINDVEQWTSAMLVYSAVYLTAHPNQNFLRTESQRTAGG